MKPDTSITESAYAQAAESIRKAKYLTAFTGAGISVESGIPPFRGTGGLWNTYDPRSLEIEFFYSEPKKSWEGIKKIFYENFDQAQPNDAHRFLAELERKGMLKELVTQNIDDLHYRAGNRNIAEFHGNSRLLVCTRCGRKVEATQALLETLPPKCTCGGVYKPDFIFFGEGIPQTAYQDSVFAATHTDCMLVIGSTGEVYPAASIPQQAKRAGATIIEINPEPSSFTPVITDIFLRAKAVEAAGKLRELLDL